MAKVKSKKRQAKRKTNLKKRRSKLTVNTQKERADYFFHEAFWYWDQMDHEKALTLVAKALRYDPKNAEMLESLVDLGYEMDRPDIMRKGLLALYNNGKIENDQQIILCDLLARDGQYNLAIDVAENLLNLLPRIKIRNKRKIRSDTIKIQEYCREQLEILQKPAAFRDRMRPKPSRSEPVESAKPLLKSKLLKKPATKAPLQNIPISIEMDTASFTEPLSQGISRFMKITPLRLKLIKSDSKNLLTTSSVLRT